MTVPSQYKGFSRLPEEVQRKMSPELANKYNMGGGVLQRPLFRQMGGPADAMPANQAMPPAPMPMAQGPDPMLQQAEAQMQGVGEQFAQQTMANIDQAEDIEGAINALRGNAKPIEARYDELAGFVGQGDAQQTPESVLAMVQPTIMMTEQGAMDSGIGQLIQSIAGSDMETPTGEPTAMGQGVGELMAMGAGNTPPVNFNQGGPVEVRRYAQGDPQGVTPIGADAFKSAFEDSLGLIQAQTAGILGTPEERARELEEAKRFQRGQAGLDLVKAGLALASPTDQPMSFAEKLAAAGQPLATSLGERAQAFQDIKRAQTAEERALAMQNVGAATNIAGQVYGKMVEQGMQGQRLGTQLTIAQMNNANAEKIAQIRTASAEDITKLNIAAQKDLLATTNAHDKEKYESAEAHDREIREIIKNYTLLIDNNKAAQSRLGNVQLAQINNNLAIQRDRLLSKLRMDERAAELGIIHSNDMKKLDFTANSAKELQTHIANLNLHQQNVQNTFTALQKALDRETTTDIASAELALKDELGKLGIEQEKLNRIQRGGIATLDFLLKEQGLDIEEAKLEIQKQYNIDLFAIEEKKLEAAGLLNNVNSKVIRFLNDQETLDKYANNQLTESEKNNFEQELMNFVSSKSTYDPNTGLITIQRNAITDSIKEALKKGNPKLFTEITGLEFKADPQTGDIVSEDKDLSNLFSSNKSGQVTLDINSPAFEDVEPSIFKPDNPYTIPIGASRLYPGGKAIFKGGMKEFFGEKGLVDVDSKKFKSAKADLNNLANELLAYSENIGTNYQDTGSSRQLKFVTERLAEQVDMIRPGGVFFRTDTDAEAVLTAFEKQLRADIQVFAQKVPEFSGVPGGMFDSKQVQKARSLIFQLLPLYKDVLLFKEYFNMGESDVSGSALKNINQEDVQKNIKSLINN